jgi:Cdc6-like AAA superfamily ATPase
MFIYRLSFVYDEENSTSCARLANLSVIDSVPAPSSLTALLSSGDHTHVKGVELSPPQLQGASRVESASSETEHSVVSLKYGILERGDHQVETDEVVHDFSNSPLKSVCQETVSEYSTTSQFKIKLSDRALENGEKTELTSVFASSSSFVLSVSDTTGQAVQLRNYQLKLAASGIDGQNCIICAPTGSGKTFTAGYICRERRRKALAEGSRFKAVFIVCIRNLVKQQRDALKQVIPEENAVTGFVDEVILSEYLKKFSVVVATAQVNLLFDASIAVYKSAKQFLLLVFLLLASE